MFPDFKIIHDDWKREIIAENKHGDHSQDAMNNDEDKSEFEAEITAQFFSENYDLNKNTLLKYNIENVLKALSIDKYSFLQYLGLATISDTLAIIIRRDEVLNFVDHFKIDHMCGALNYRNNNQHTLNTMPSNHILKEMIELEGAKCLTHWSKYYPPIFYYIQMLFSRQFFEKLSKEHKNERLSKIDISQIADSFIELTKKNENNSKNITDDMQDEFSSDIENVEYEIIPLENNSNPSSNLYKEAGNELIREARKKAEQISVEAREKANKIIEDAKITVEEKIASEIINNANHQAQFTLENAKKEADNLKNRKIKELNNYVTSLGLEAIEAEIKFFSSLQNQKDNMKAIIHECVKVFMSSQNNHAILEGLINHVLESYSSFRLIRIYAHLEDIPVIQSILPNIQNTGMKIYLIEDDLLLPGRIKISTQNLNAVIDRDIFLQNIRNTIEDIVN